MLQKSILTHTFLLALTTSCSTNSKIADLKEAEPARSIATEENTATTENTENPVTKELTQSVTVTTEQVSMELELPLPRLTKETKILDQFLRTNKFPDELCEDSEDDNSLSESLCELAFAIKGNPKGLKASSKPSVGRKVPVRPQHFKTQQGFHYTRLLKSLHKANSAQVLVWSPKLLETTSCPRNLSAAALRKLENLLPSPAVFNMMEKLYEHASACMRPSDEGFEITHFRQALLRHLNGKEELARQSIRKALASENSSEKPRVLYWAGLLEKNLTRRKKAWTELVQSYPLSFHALEVWDHMGVDPYEIFSNRPALNLERKTLGENAQIDASVRWLEMLYMQGHVESAQKLSRWLTGHYRDQINPSTLLYISSLKSARGTPLNTITFLTRTVAENPVILNQQTLKLLFPRPFFETFEKASPNTDTFLILAVARQESGFNPRARSNKNAQGLLQILPSTARVLTGKKKNNLYEAETNAHIGVKYLSQLINKLGSVELALGGYNAGPGRIPEWKERFPTDDPLLFLDLIPFKETRNYISSILRNNYWYERLYRDDSSLLAQKTFSQLQQKSETVARLVSNHTNNKRNEKETQAVNSNFSEQQRKPAAAEEPTQL
jgi:soluble lytic murein transglycosylase